VPCGQPLTAHGGPRAAAYERIGRGYSVSRQPDPRIARRLHEALGDAATVLNVGAGTGNYEPRDRFVVALEPAVEMLRQRDPDAAPPVRAVAEAIPFPAGSFDAALAVLTLHHWTDLGHALSELQRVAGRQVVFMFDTDRSHAAWLVQDYFPQIAGLATERGAPGVRAVSDHLEVRAVEPVPVPADCSDGFALAFWNRPEAYLDPDVRRSMSCFALLDDASEQRGVARLEADLRSGHWERRYGHLRELHELDLGYRLLIAGGDRS
jgi:SAM-dependent methyltransferase